MKRENLPVIMCIGTDLVGGDCLGPLVGQLLIARNLPCFVYGTLYDPITALNLKDYYAFIKKNHISTVIAVDSCVGENVGRISVNSGGLLPGAAGGKDLPMVGDISVTAVTSSYPPSDKRFASVRLGFVYSLALQVADTIETLIKGVAV
ncbi:MAG: spore protease YyaC [Clostridiales bacterium]|nr:spore protease YyaC [Clostridiales bacterium]